MLRKISLNSIKHCLAWLVPGFPIGFVSLVQLVVQFVCQALFRRCLAPPFPFSTIWYIKMCVILVEGCFCFSHLLCINDTIRLLAMYVNTYIWFNKQFSLCHIAWSSGLYFLFFFCICYWISMYLFRVRFYIFWRWSMWCLL